LFFNCSKDIISKTLCGALSLFKEYIIAFHGLHHGCKKCFDKILRIIYCMYWNLLKNNNNFVIAFLGLSQVVLITKIDKVCSNVEEDVSTVFQSDTIQELVDTVSNILGIPRSHVLPVKNYEKEINVRDDVSLLALHSLRQILRASEDFMFNLLDMLDDERETKGSDSTE
jgi:hypothetical protein